MQLDFFNASETWKVLSACTKHLKMDLHKSSNLCHGCSPFREVVSDALGKGSLWNTQVRARGEVKPFKYSQPKTSQSLFRLIVGRKAGVWP